MAFITAMSKDEDASKTADIRVRLGVSDSYLQIYKKRLSDAGIISSRKRGELEFDVPYLGEYLRENNV
jgi:DNA-binding IscR family transcriptional regulator